MEDMDWGGCWAGVEVVGGEEGAEEVEEIVEVLALVGCPFWTPQEQQPPVNGRPLPTPLPPYKKGAEIGNIMINRIGQPESGWEGCYGANDNTNAAV